MYIIHVDKLQHKGLGLGLTTWAGGYKTFSYLKLELKF